MRRWTEKETQLFIALYPDHPNAYIAEVLHRTITAVKDRANILDLCKAPDFLKQQREKGQFKAGQQPFNKGRAQKYWMTDCTNSVKTRFQKGRQPHNTRPPGFECVRTEKNGRRYVWIKPSDGRRMMPKHRWLWEQAYGKPPKGYNVQFKDGNTLNCTIENLYLIARSKQMRENFNKQTDEQKAEMWRKITRKRNETIRRDRLRLKWGIEPMTKLVKRRPT